MEKYCGQCERLTTHSSKDVEIKVGSQVFKTAVEACTVCGAYERDRNLRKKINEWGESLSSSFDTLQPRFSQTIHDYLDQRSSEHGLDKSKLVKAMYVFYLNHAIRHKEFKKVREFLRSHESSFNMVEGEKKKFPVRVSYRAFRKLEAYGLVWKCAPAKGIEDAVDFCIGLEAVTDKESNDLLRELAEKYREVVEDIAMAA